MHASTSEQGARRTSRKAIRVAAAATALCALTLASTSSLVAAQYPSQDTACTRHYTVEDGDTCDIIGQKTWTSTYQIMALNLPKAGPNCYGLETGARLCLGRYGNDCQFVHYARDYDTCESIAGHWEISVDHLKANNPSLSCGQIYEGLMLCVSKGLVRPPAAASLNVSGAAYQQAQMPLGTAITPKVIASQTIASSIQTGMTQSAAGTQVGSTASSAATAASTAQSIQSQGHYSVRHRRASQFNHH